MRASGIRTAIFVGAVALFASRPQALLAQIQAARGGRAVAVVQAVVPSIVKYLVDETTRTADGSPTVRVLTNDPAIRAAFARGVTPELAPVILASTAPEQSGHVKGDQRLETTPEGAKVLRYTVVAP